MSYQPIFPPESDWDSVLLAMRGWDREFGLRDLDGYRMTLRSYPGAVVLRALEQLTLAGTKFFPRPNPAEIAAECLRITRPDLTPVTWTEFWNAFLHAMGDSSVPTGRQHTRRERAVAVGELVAAALRSPIAGNFAAQIYPEASRSPIDGDHGGAITARYAKEFEGHQAELRARAARGSEPLTPAQALAAGDRPVRALEAGQRRAEFAAIERSTEKLSDAELIRAARR